MIDVLIIGAGPTGTTLAIDLARRGLTVRIVDKAPGSFEGSRAKGLQPRTLEVLEDLGVVDDILAGGSPYPKLGIHLGPLTLPWRMFQNTEPTASVPYPNTWLIPQFRIDSALHARLERLQSKVEYGCTLLSFVQGSDAITAEISTPNGHESIQARYLVGADGGSSDVRKRLGFKFEGATDDADRILIVDAVVTGLSRDRWHLWPGRRGFVGACPLPHSDLFQWMIRLAPDEEVPGDLDGISRRIRAHTGTSRIALHRVQWQSVFRPNIRLVEHYRGGRVFLAGDAAHVHTPAGAQGLNTGIQDAYNLGWKLAQVLGGADEALLDTYEAERRPIAAGVLGLSTKKYQAIARLDPAAIRRGKDEQQLALSYRHGPLAQNSARTRTLQGGDRAPDARLRNAEGQQVRLFDSLRGPHFTSVAYGQEAADDLDRFTWPALGAPLRRVVIDGTSASAGHVLSDAEGTFRKAYGISKSTLLLFRPDGYMACIATQDMLAETQGAAQRLAPSVCAQDDEVRQEVPTLAKLQPLETADVLSDRALQAQAPDEQQLETPLGGMTSWSARHAA